MSSRESAKQTPREELDSNSSDDEDGGERLRKLEKKKADALTSKQGRTGVSAEVYGKNNKKSDFHPPVVPKSEVVRARILEKLGRNIMFRSLEAEHKQILIDAMEEKTFRY